MRILTKHQYIETEAHKLQGMLRCICINCTQFHFMSKSPSKPVCTIQNVISDLPALMVSMIINCHEFYVWLHNFGTHFFFTYMNLRN